MASTTTGNTVFTQGEFNKRLEEWLANPNQLENPGAALLKCLPKCEYNNQDYLNVKVQLDQIISESQFYESKRIYNYAVQFKEQLEQIECIGVDTCLLFNGYFEAVNEFIDYWTENKDNQALETEVTQNPNYFNN